MEVSVLSRRELNLCFFHIVGNLVMQLRFLMTYIVFISIPAPAPITFAEMVPSNSNELSFET